MDSQHRHLGLCLAGGGNRAFWQIGMLGVLGDEILPRVAGISGASAGAAAAVINASGGTERAISAFSRLRADVERNFDVRLLLARKPPMPHQRIYRAILEEAIGEEGLAKIKASPYPIRILAAEPPKRLRVGLGLAAGLVAYQMEKAVRPHALHPSIAPRLGFRAHVYDARDCSTVDEVVELVLASSSTPPITKLGSFGGARLLDGSLIDNAPAFALDDLPEVDRTLVLLTRAYPEPAVGLRGKRLYVPPSISPPAERWDYRRVAPIEETIELGRSDGLAMRDRILSFLESSAPNAGTR